MTTDQPGPRAEFPEEWVEAAWRALRPTGPRHHNLCNVSRDVGECDCWATATTAEAIAVLTAIVPLVEAAALEFCCADTEPDIRRAIAAEVETLEVRLPWGPTGAEMVSRPQVLRIIRGGTQ